MSRRRENREIWRWAIFAVVGGVLLLAYAVGWIR